MPPHLADLHLPHNRLSGAVPASYSFIPSLALDGNPQLHSVDGALPPRKLAAPRMSATSRQWPDRVRNDAN